MQNENSLSSSLEEFRYLVSREHDEVRLYSGSVPYRVIVQQDKILLSVNRMRVFDIQNIRRYDAALKIVYGLDFTNLIPEKLDMSLFSKCNFSKFEFEFEKLSKSIPSLLCWDKSARKINKIRNGPMATMNEFNSLILRSQS